MFSICYKDVYFKGYEKKAVTFNFVVDWYIRGRHNSTVDHKCQSAKTAD